MTELRTLRPQVAGYTFRAPALEDRAAVCELQNHCRRLISGHDEKDFDSLCARWADPQWHMEIEGLVATTTDRTIVGWAEIHNRGAWTLIECEGGIVHPEHRGRGLEEALMDWSVRTARERASDVPADKEVMLRHGCDLRDEFGNDLMERSGFEVIRYFFLMRKELWDVGTPVWPEGITVRSMRRPEDDAPFWTAKYEAFLDHWGMSETGLEEGIPRFQHWIDSDPSFDPKLFRAAMAGDEVAGVCFTLPMHHADPTEADLAILGVRQPWRRKGIAHALLLDAFEQCKEYGLKSVALGVDASNPTGAVALYEGAGMHVAERYQTWGLVLQAGAPEEKGGTE